MCVCEYLCLYVCVLMVLCVLLGDEHRTVELMLQLLHTFQFVNSASLL